MKISVALCTYNGQKFIEQQLDSILEQSRRIDEIIICDDQSTDQTVSMIAAKLQTAPWLTSTIMVNEERLGPGHNFERACALCTGDIIFLSDQDDVWEKEKVSIMAALFENDAVAMVYSNADYIDSKGEFTGNPVLQDMENYVDSLLRRGRSPNGCLMALRRSTLNHAYPFYITAHFFHDGWIGCVMPCLGDIKYVDRFLVHYRQHEGSITQSSKRKRDYESFLRECPDYKLRFRLDVFSEERDSMIQRTLESVPENCENTRTLALYKASVIHHMGMHRASERSRIYQILFCFKEYVLHRYYFMDTDGIQSTVLSRVKRLICDVRFIIHNVK